ncbi:MAG: response regulator, partial [Treponema sp.]|nr:response regulator [Treponema sp.]
NIGFIINTTDVTEIIEQQKKTAEQKILLDTIFSASPDLIWYRNLNGNILAANPRYASLSGRDSKDLVGMMEEDLIPAEHIPFYQESSRKVLEKRGPSYFEQRLEFADGHMEILDTVLTPISSDGGSEVTGILGFARDVSARVHIEKELRETQKELEKTVREANLANEHKSFFLARMSHEIRTPMNAIIGMTGIVKKKLGAERLDLGDININIGQIETSSQHLLNLLNDILDISKIEAGKIELSPETVDLLKLSGAAETIIRPRCEEKNISFEVLFDLPPDKVYQADPLRLRQVLINLLGNAVKFTPEGGKIFFTVARRESGGEKARVDFLVRDTGIGIPGEAVDSLFRPFEQVGKDTSRKYGGTGLGLAISQSIIRLFGSDIRVKSKLGEGSEFSFSLFLSENDPEEKEKIDFDNAGGRLKGRRALLVDDVAINRIITINLLESTGLEIDEADDGDSALEIFKKAPENHYDIIYMDIQMPRMNGYEAAEAIRALNRSDAKTVPIVALTANAFKEDIDRALGSGMNAHLAKPMDPDKALEVSFRLLG